MAVSISTLSVLPPAIIDFAPCWRPAGVALAIVVADALVWEGADASTGGCPDDRYGPAVDLARRLAD